MYKVVKTKSLVLFAVVVIILALAGGFFGGYLAARSGFEAFSELVSPENEARECEDSSDENRTDPAAGTDVEGATGNRCLTIPEIYDQAAESVVEISTETVQSNPFFGQYITGGAGSGVIIRTDGYIVTNNHVIENAQSVTVRLENGATYSATLIGSDRRTDLAILKIEESGLKAARFGNSDQLIVGEPAVVIGNPLGELGGTVTEGIISALDREIVIGGESMALLQTSAAVNPGNSGGGLFNSQAELIGIINAKSGGVNIEGLGFAIPANTAKAVIDSLIDFGYVTGRPALGVRLLEVIDQNMAAFYRVPSPGVYIYEVTVPNGLEPGDRIISIEGKPVQLVTDIRAIIDPLAVGDNVTIEIAREGEELSISLTLIELTSS